MKQPHCVLGVTALFLIPSALFAQLTFNTVPTRILGQAVIQQQITATAPNLAEGRELYFPQAIAADTSASPAILYVADTDNNRVLGWKNSATFANGAPADLVIGQRDFYSTQPQGPGHSITYGLSSPTAVVVDSAGSLYVTDSGNNRILRFPKPFSQTSGNVQPDFVIGQASLNTNNANRGGSPAANTLATTSGGGILQAGLTFDTGGNLWASDPGNNRVLRFPKAALAGKTFGPAADLVLGQPNFTSNALPANPVNNDKSFVAQPAGLAFDQTGYLYVADSGNRVLVWSPSPGTGTGAGRILGVDVPTQQNPNPPAVSAKTLKSPSGVVAVGIGVYVMDTGNNRILGYPPPSQWPDETTSFAPPANVVIGQPDFASSKPNQGQLQPGAGALFAPTGAAYTGTDLFVSDANNNRVLDFPVSGGAVAAGATRVLGQTTFQYRALNLIEGREVFFNGTDPALGLNISGAGLAVDTRSNPPHLYVSDTGNHRILGFNDVRKVTNTSKADIVIGQPDLSSNIVNYPNNDPASPSASGLFLPENIAVDVSGNLWVADFGNARVVRFPTPFAAGHSGASAQANLVLGQSSPNGPTITGAAANTMTGPYGIAIGATGNVFVSDFSLNRVLLFRQPSGGDFRTGQNADGVFGEPDLFTSTVQSGTSGLNSPRGIAVDSSDRLYVADSGNGRVAIFANASSAPPGPPPSLSLSSLASPNAVAYSVSDGTIWVANSGASTVLQYPSYNLLPLNPSPIATLNSASPLALTVDTSGNPLVAEAVNRVSFYYPAMRMANSANYFPRYAPGMLASLFNIGSGHFGPAKAQFNTVPLPTQLGDVQVLVAGKAAPLLYVSQQQINFQIPSSTPVGLQEVDVLRVSTDEVLASNFFQIEATSPGLFTSDATGQGQIAAVNVDDGTINSQTHPVKAGHFISLYGTGQGAVVGGPPDGTPSQGQVKTQIQPQVYMGGATYIPQSDVEYSGLAPGYIGLWQINAKVPADAAPGAVTVFVNLNGAISSLLDTGQRITTTIYVTQ